MIDLTPFKRCKIGVLAGGFSSEREVSLKSGKAVFEALSAVLADVRFIDITGPSIDAALDVDIAFIALHGKFGEDGTIQRMLTEKGIPYTGSGPGASRLAMDKLDAKSKFKAAGLKVADHIVVAGAEDLSGKEVWCPCVVKPRYEGSSVGLTVVKSRGELEKAVSHAAKYGQDVIVEDYIHGRELTVGILEERALPIVEIEAAGGVYDFQAKYRSSDTRYIVPAGIEEGVYKRCQDTGLRAHQALGCVGISRVDVRMGEDGGLYVLEVNTIPGMTERSLLPMAAKAAGIDFSELCCRIVRSAINSKKKDLVEA